ncbi:MAG: AAA family ATPase [Pseudonocardiaceae bacterium]|nr:AAA family ATPase [Pseudonocardiaceae bacterium]
MTEQPIVPPSAGAAPSVPRAKVSPPPATGLARRRLLTPLHDAGHARVVLVTAPPGAGKTTLLAEFTRECRHSSPDRALAWCRIEGQDASATGLLRILAASITVALEGSERELRSDDELLALLEQPGPRLTIVIDDAHLLAGTAAEATLARIIRLLPDRAQALLAARSEPGFVSGLRLSGVVADITADDLRFRSWEVEALFRECYGLPLPPEDAAALTRHTEGWAAGLQLFHLATSGKPAEERRRAVANLWGMSRLLRRYLTSHVLATLPEDVAEFLVRSAALGVLEGTLCDRLLDRTGSHLVLRDLAEAQLFTLRCDDEDSYYRYHAVLQSQLESMLAERLGTDGARSWYRRAGALLDDAGLWSAAYRAYARAEDWGAGAQVLQRYGVCGTEDPAAALVPRLLDDDPWLSLAEARRHAAAGRLAEAIGAFEDSEQRFDDPGMRQRCRTERRLLVPWSASTPPGWGVTWSDGLRAAVRSDPARLRRTAALATEPGWQLATGLAELLDGHPDPALRALRQAAAAPAGFVPLAARVAIAAVGATVGAGCEDTTGEDVEMPARDIEALALDAELAGHPWLARIARAVAAAGNAAAVAGIAEDCDADGDAWGALLITSLGAAGKLRAGAAAEPELAAVAQRARGLEAEAVASWLRAVRPGCSGGVIQQRSRIVLRCFGRFSLAVDGCEVDLSALRPRARAALRLLALHAGRAVHEEVLLDALWPDLPPAAGKRNLQVTISSVRAVLEPGRSRGAPSMLQRRGEAYLLDLPDDADADILTFSRSLARSRAASSPAQAGAALRAALAACDGELLPEDGPAEWVVPERERLRAGLAEAATSLAGLALADGDAAGAAQAAQTAIRADGFHDAAWRLLIEACEQAGDLAAAHRARHGYQAALAELGCAL